MNPKSQDTYTQTYNRWVTDPSPDNLADLLATFSPTINAEIQQYSGPKELLRSRAKSYVIKAIRTYDPLGKTSLNSWVVTNLKQLSRYGKRLRPIRSSEETIRNIAELHRITSELEDTFGRKPSDEEIQDQTGWSLKEISKLRDASLTVVSHGGSQTSTEDDQGPEESKIDELDEIPFIRDSVYASLDPRDRDIFDYKMGTNGKQQLSGKDIAAKLNVTPAYISQRASGIGSLITELGS